MNFTTRSRTVKDCFNSLNNLGNHNDLEIRWIAAHSGLWGNEKADELAKQGTSSDTIQSCPIPQSYIKMQINHKVTRLNEANWNANAPKHTSMILGKKQATIRKNLNTTLINNRKKYRTAVQLITGHCGLNKYLNKMRKVPSAICPKCDYEEE